MLSYLAKCCLMESSDSGEEMVPFPSSGTDISRYALSLAAYMSSSFLLFNTSLSFRCGSVLEAIGRFAALDLYVVVDCLNVSFVIARERCWPRFEQLSLKNYWLSQWAKHTYICVGNAGFTVAMVACFVASFTLKQGAWSTWGY